jgi:hypothetical protein
VIVWRIQWLEDGRKEGSGVRVGEDGEEEEEEEEEEEGMRRRV